jgi:hypothetical protein
MVSDFSPSFAAAQPGRRVYVPRRTRLDQESALVCATQAHCLVTAAEAAAAANCHWSMGLWIAHLANHR